MNIPQMHAQNHSPIKAISIFCAIFSVYFGFRATMLVAVGTYLLAMWLYRSMYIGYLQDQQSA